MNFDTLIQKALGRQTLLGIQLNPPATTDVIAAFEKTFEITLPDELQSFYRQCNGFETDDVLFRVIPLEEAIRELEEYNNGVKGSAFTFAEYMIYSDVWMVRLKPEIADAYEIINQNHGTEPIIVLTDSILEFIIRYAESGGDFGDEGLYKWFEERKALGY
ncbi:SMI1/KNR4 family protein [Hymenobacter negativus]|uniref:SMI1/KNR4 family protein n=1 Tax=Hymenobacter negativus TaxID=2795026 RepID=A0ABS3QIR2_9BACT|nr:SMI1/KNR4 family protein [Hymenobacter negativus]MBO2011132.1 SMI1/KNR4 family protein [Hymenobacter negativus]